MSTTVPAITPATAAVADDARPDALFVPERIKRGRTLGERIDSILALAEPLLGVDRAAGGRAYIRRQGDGWLFVTDDPGDTIYHPLRTPLQRRPMYTWVDRPDGVRLGYLTPEAKVARDARRKI